jgi:hypothetical protein
MLCESHGLKLQDVDETFRLVIQNEGEKMGSIHRETRVRQKAEQEARLKAIEAKLKTEGMDDAKISQSPAYRQAAAGLRKAELRIKAIDAKDALNQSLAEKKAAGKSSTKPKGGKKAAKEKDNPKKKNKSKNK